MLYGEGRQMGVKADRMGSERAAITFRLSPLVWGVQVHVAQTKLFSYLKIKHIYIYI